MPRYGTTENDITIYSKIMGSCFQFIYFTSLKAIQSFKESTIRILRSNNLVVIGACKNKHIEKQKEAKRHQFVSSLNYFVQIDTQESLERTSPQK